MDTTARKLQIKGPSTPAGALTGAAVASLLAGVLVFSALKAGNDGGDAPVVAAAPVSVIVADKTIPKGSSGEAIAAGRIAAPTDVRESEVAAGAITDIDSLRGQVATHDIFPGEQLSAADFTAAGAQTLTTKLTGSVRGVSIPIDSAHGMVGQAQPGDHVDVYATFQTRNAKGDEISVLKPLAANVEVLRTPKAEEGDDASKASATDQSVVTLRMVGRKAANLAFAADSGKIWLVLRPPTGAVENSSKIVTLQTLLASGRTGATGVTDTDPEAAGGSDATAADSTAKGGSGLPKSAPFEDLEQSDPFGDVKPGSKTTSTTKGK